MIYICYNPYATRKTDQEWTGEISYLKTSNGCIEMNVTGRGSSFHIIIGRSNRGNYICIPQWKVGCELASFSDYFWNQERLTQQLGNVDAITVATAIKEANQLINTDSSLKYIG